MQQDQGHDYEDVSEILNASTSGNESNSSILKVRMNFIRRKNASRVRVSRALSKAHRQMNTLRK